MAKDGRLKLSEKLSLAALEKNKSKEVAVDPQYRHLPKGKDFSLIHTFLPRHVESCLCRSKSEEGEVIEIVYIVPEVHVCTR